MTLQQKIANTFVNYELDYGRLYDGVDHTVLLQKINQVPHGLHGAQLCIGVWLNIFFERSVNIKKICLPNKFFVNMVTTQGIISTGSKAVIALLFKLLQTTDKLNESRFHQI